MVTLIGMGSGKWEALSAQAQQAVRSAGLVFGAKRLLAGLPPECTARQFALYQPADILETLAQNPGQDAAVLYSGDTVEVSDSSDSTYWYVYSAKLGKYDYVNKNYLYNGTSGVKETRIVSVTSGYLALRNQKAFDASNEIGKLYTGDTVQLLDTSDSTYWYVYSPKYDKNGYVNRNYLVTDTSSPAPVVTKTVRVTSGYLALRNDTAYDASNEIGKLYTGDTVTVIDSSGSTYWYVYSPKLDRNGYVNKNYLY